VFESSIDTLVDVVKMQGPFDGIMGFSQGAALAAMICLDSAAKKATSKMVDAGNNECAEYVSKFPAELSNFKFAILFSGFCSKSSEHTKIYKKVKEMQQSDKAEYLEDCIIPTLHVIGNKSRVISRAMSAELLHLFGKKNAHDLQYPGGHFVPRGGINQKTGYLSFVAKMKKLCFEGKIEEVSGKLQNMAVKTQVSREDEGLQPALNLDTPSQDVDSEDAEFASPLVQSPTKEVGTESNITKPGEGADHPVIRAIQEL
jgi:dihydrofolate reductase